MRMNYKSYPTDYVQELKQSGKRKKARAFMEYWDDMKHGSHNTIRFYAKSWDVSVGSTSNWIKEFNDEIDLFFAHWDIRNKQHYNYAKNQAEQKLNKMNSDTAQETGLHGKVNEHDLNEDFNINNNNNKSDRVLQKDFNELYFVYSVNTKYKGKKEDAWQAYKNLNVDTNLLKLAIVKYLHDPDTEGKRYNMANFLKNEVYLSYMPKKIKLIVDGVERVGFYDNTTKIFTSTTDRFAASITPKRLVELYESGRLEFLKD